MMPELNRSIPAGTEVCVVKTLLVREASSASSKTHLLIGHQAADPLDGKKGRVPFIHVINGRPEASSSSTRNPPMPSAISCRIPVVQIAAIKLSRDYAMHRI